MADASHELRTPVAIVRGEAEVSLTKDDRESSEYRETISIMQNEAKRMSRIIEDLFTLTRADAGENPVQKKSVYLEDILADTVKSFRSIASKRNVNLTLETNNEMPTQADEQLLHRLFSNLLDNAIKHAKTAVNINAAIENGIYKIRFSDDGEGISIENQPHIFERFFRVDKARSRQKESPVGVVPDSVCQSANGSSKLTKALWNLKNPMLTAQLSPSNFLSLTNKNPVHLSFNFALLRL